MFIERILHSPLPLIIMAGDYNSTRSNTTSVKSGGGGKEPTREEGGRFSDSSIRDSTSVKSEGGDGKQPTREAAGDYHSCLLYTSPSPRDLSTSRMPSSA